MLLTAKFDTDDPQSVLNYAQTMAVPIFKAKERPTPVTVIGPMVEPTEIRTTKGVMRGPVGSYIVIGKDNDCFPVRPDVFKETYESPIVGLRNPDDIDGILERMGRR